MKNRLNKTVVAAASGAMLLMALPIVSMTSVSGAAMTPTYTIGVEGPFTGPDSFLGNPVYGGVELAINAANAANMGFKLKAAKFDDQCSSSVSPAEAQKAVGTSNLIAVVGGVCSGATEAANPYYLKNSVADVSPSATAVALASAKGTFFRVVADDSVQGAADAQYLVKNLHVTNLLVIGDASFYGAGLASVVAKDAKADGATVTTQSIPNVNSGGGGTVSEYGGAATSIATKDPGAIFYGGYASDFGLLLGALSTAGYTTSSHPIMSGDGSNESALITDTSPASAANGVYVSQSAAGSVNYFTGKLATAYQKLTKQKASAAEYAAQAYDAANAIIKSFEKVTSKKTIKAIRAGVVAQLRKVSFTGVTGKISFAANGNLKDDTGAVAVSKVTNGVITSVTTVKVK